jgi:galactokinase
VTTPDALDHVVRARFRATFGYDAPSTLAAAPGRVNLIGEHTDYNDGFVLPMAIERGIRMAFALRTDRRLRLHALDFSETVEVDLEDLAPRSVKGWAAYVAGTAWALGRAGHATAGIDAAFGSDLPIGAGLSSSAALEMATARALCEASGVAWDAPAMARVGQTAENEFVGVNCGIMDQFASAASQEGCALLLDCRSLETRSTAIPARAMVVIMDTGARRTLAGSAYNDRRASCEAAVAALARLAPGIKALRDVDDTLLSRGRETMDEMTFRRAAHVVPENRRPVEMAAALEGGDLETAGRLMNESHASLRDLYEVSSSELDLVTDIARRHAACYGARMTGAGFGGCAVALVDAARADSFVVDAHAAYKAQVNLPSSFFACRPAAGARLQPSV